MDAATRETSRALLSRQLPNGSWNNDLAATALALQALSSVEPPVAAYDAAAQAARSWLMSRPSGDARDYAIAYALAAVTPRPGQDDRSGLLCRSELRPGLKSTLHKSCGAFEIAVVLNALGKTGLTKAELTAPKRSGRPSACPDRAPDPKDAAIRDYATAIMEFNAGLPGPGDAKKLFDELIERAQSGASPDLGSLLWATAGFREMRYRMVEPARGCYFSGDLLGRKILALRRADGSWGGDLQDASALTALVNLRRTFVPEVPYEKTR